MVSFEPRAEVEKANITQHQVAVSNCCVKRSRGNALEILDNNKSSIMSLPKKTTRRWGKSTHKEVTSGCQDISTFEELKDLQEHQHINVVGKVQSVWSSSKLMLYFFV